MKVPKSAKRVAKQLFRDCLINGGLDETRVRSVVRHVVEARRRQSSAILSHFTRLVRLEVARHTAVVESATPLAPEVQAAIRAGLTRRYGAHLHTAFALQPALIGGTRIQVGSDVYDGSVRGGLAALENSLSR
ncbi:MAG: FoF1 ATP synthase subunit delta [Candidatus Binatia bacterium]